MERDLEASLNTFLISQDILNARLLNIERLLFGFDEIDHNFLHISNRYFVNFFESDYFLTAHSSCFKSKVFVGKYWTGWTSDPDSQKLQRLRFSRFYSTWAILCSHFSYFVVRRLGPILDQKRSTSQETMEKVQFIISKK